MQGGWMTKDPYTQLPFVDSTFSGKLKNKLGGMTLFNYCMLSANERKAIVEDIFEDKAKEVHQEHEEVISTLPLVKLTMTAFVEGEDEIVVGDILTCKMRVDYYNISKG